MNVFLHKIFRFTFQNVLDKIVLNFFVGGSSITDNRAWCPAVFLRHFLFQSMGVCSLFLALESIKLQPLCNIIHQHMKMNNMHISSSMYLKSNPPFFYDLISNVFKFESKYSVITAEFECLMQKWNYFKSTYNFLMGYISSTLSTLHCALNSWKSFKEVMHLNFAIFHCKPNWSWWNTKN